MVDQLRRLAANVHPSARAAFLSTGDARLRRHQKNRHKKVERRVFEAGGAKLGLVPRQAALLFDALDGDCDGAVSMADFNNATRAFLRGEPLPQGHAAAQGGSGAGSRDATPSRRQPR